MSCLKALPRSDSSEHALLPKVRQMITCKPVQSERLSQAPSNTHPPTPRVKPPIAITQAAKMFERNCELMLDELSGLTDIGGLPGIPVHVPFVNPLLLDRASNGGGGKSHSVGRNGQLSLDGCPRKAAATQLGSWTGIQKNIQKNISSQSNPLKVE